RWSALAWLDPDLLAKEMALALKDTFPARQDEAEDDRGQLRIYMLADRLNKQIGLDIHSKSGSPRLFVNFQRYTNMNMLRLLGNDVDFYEGYDRLEGEFIATDRGDGSAVTLPLKKGIGSRLYRNKNNIQRVFPVLIGFAPFFTTIVENLKRQALFGDLEYSQDDFTPVANAKEIRDTLEMISLLANDEDLVLIVYSQAMEKQFPLIELVNFLNGKRRSGYRLLLIADTSNTDFTRSTSERTIALWLPQYNYTYLTTVLDSVESRISYKDLYHLLQSIDFSIRPLFFIPEDQWNNYFLRRQSGTIPHDDAYIIYDRDRHRWKIWEEDFNPVPDGARGRIFDLTGKQVPDNMGGFVRKHESGMYLEVGDESLTQQYVYRFRPEGPGLTYYTNEDIPDLPVVPYSRWKSFEGASEDNAALQILQHHHIDLSYEVTYHDREVSEQYRWTPTTPEEFTRLLTKLNRWAFLKYMMLPNHEQGFEIKEHYYKEDKSADPDTLLLKTVDGVVAFEDLQINILPFENFDFYVDIYLLLDDLSIIRLIHSSEPISPSTTTSFRIPGETIPMKILERELRFTLKFLYSRDPIITDFSQDGY
ncbi:MAG TPA: hypothetical protein VI233_02450, partial [Puia sp.]